MNAQCQLGLSILWPKDPQRCPRERDGTPRNAHRVGCTEQSLSVHASLDACLTANERARTTVGALRSREGADAHPDANTDRHDAHRRRRDPRPLPAARSV